MKDLFKDYLFTKGYLVNDNHPLLNQYPAPTAGIEEAFAAAMELARRFGISVFVGHARNATKDMISVAERNLGVYVPLPFYQNFPMSVRELTPDQKLYDQLHHYAITYGMGYFDEPGHSIFEGEVRERLGLTEETEQKQFRIISESKALELLHSYAKELLQGTRPLSSTQKTLILELWNTYLLMHSCMLPERIPCKDTAVTLYCETGDRKFFERGHLKLPDTIKALNYIQYNRYGSENLKKLNLKNQDRKVIARFIDECFAKGDINAMLEDIRECFEKRKIWVGLLHHIHYKAKNAAALYFVMKIRNGENHSVPSMTESLIAEGRIVEAANKMKMHKGASYVARNLNYLISRCKTTVEIEGVLKCLE